MDTMLRVITRLAAAAFLLAHAAPSAHAQTSTAFTYQGSLEDNGQPANGSYDLDFRLYDSAAGPGLLAVVSLAATPVVDGRFSVVLDFPVSDLLGGERWLDIRVNNVVQSPRQRIYPTPFALRMRGMFTNQDATFVGVGREFSLNSFESFGVQSPVSGTSYGSMYINTISNNARPFYGYAPGAGNRVWTYVDGTNGKWHVNNAGDRLTVDPDGRVGIGTINPLARLDVFAGGPAITAISALSANTAIVGATTGTLAGNYGVFGQQQGSSSWAVFASGRFGATGTKSFRIDHPLDPTEKYLIHYASEAPEPLNIYSGVVALNAQGEAWVDLPGYFSHINRDPRYQLTCIGGHADVYIADEIHNNRFRIAGGRPGIKVSWEIAAVRNDHWVRAYGTPVEVDKPAELRGRYQHPELYGLGPEFAEHPLPLAAVATAHEITDSGRKGGQTVLTTPE